MAISFVAKSAFASGTGALSVGAVSGVASGDLILLFVESANQAITTPSGYTVVTGAQVSAGTAAAAGGMLLNVFYKWATGADSTTTVADSGDHTTAIKLAYRGVDSTTPFAATPVTGTKTTASTSSTYPGITTATANALVIYASALDLDASSTATTSAQANANLTSLTERHDQTVTSGVGGGIVLTDGFKAAAGATGNMTATVTSTQQVYITLALRPQGAVTHATSGALVGQGSTVAGSAIRLAPGGNILQTAYAVDDSGGNGTTIAATLNGVTAGSAIVVFVGYSKDGTISSVSDGTAYTAAADGRCDNTPDNQSSSVYYLLNAGAGNHTVTVTFSPTIAWRRMRLVEIAGIATSNAEDGSAHQVQAGVGTGTDSISSGATGTTSNANDFILGLTQDATSVDPGSGTLAAGTGYTLSGTNQMLGVEGKNVSSTGAQTATFTDTKNSGRNTHVLALKTLSSGPATHSTSGALVGQGATVAGTAAHVAVHGSSGALVGQGSTVTGSANRFRAHPTTGALVGQGSTITGSAARSSGAVTHDTSGALVGQGATIAGAASRFRDHATTGALVGSGSNISGNASRSSGAVTHDTSGALVGSGSSVSGSAARYREHATTGALIGPGAVLVGAANRYRQHDVSGVLVGAGSTIAGAASRTRLHDTSGDLLGSGATLSGAAARSHLHTSSGSLVGQGAVIVGAAGRTNASGYPDPSTVLAGVIYGPGGIYTGTLVSFTTSIKFDIATGQLVKPLSDSLVTTL